MINFVYRLVKPKNIDIQFTNEIIKSNHIIIKPKYLSICAADERYYFGNRDLEVLKKKLPMALVHEAVGEVLYDPTNEYKAGDKVVLIPNTPIEEDSIIKSNYLRSSIFRSSGYDGFMQSVINIRKDCIIKLKTESDLKLYSLLETISVCINALTKFDKLSHSRKEVIGVWGSGSIGYTMSLILKYKYPSSKIIVFGKNSEKLNAFSFIDEKYLITDVPSGLKVDHAFECVGGIGSEKAIRQIIDLANPEATISLLGVSENEVLINTRMVLEKGLVFHGNSRSDYNDFMESVKLLDENEKFREYMKNIISEVVDVTNIMDMNNAFEKSINNNFKTIMKWEI